LFKSTVFQITELKSAKTSVRGNPGYKFVPTITANSGAVISLGSWRYFPGNNGYLKGPGVHKYGKDIPTVKLNEMAKWEMKWLVEFLILEREEDLKALELVKKCFIQTENHIVLNSSVWSEQKYVESA